MLEPLVSVVIPTFNRAALLIEAVSSVFAQTYRNLEILVIDDGSTDGTRQALASSFSDKRLRYYHQENRGLAASRNRGIELAAGHLIAFLDSDDLWMPLKLERQVEALSLASDVGLAYCHFTLIDEGGRELVNNWRPTNLGNLQLDLLFGNVIAGSGSAVVARAACFKNAGLFDERLATCEDHDMWGRLAQHYRFAKVEENLVKIRVHGSSMQRDISRMQQGMMLHLRKILAETPAIYAPYLPAVTRQFHREVLIAWTHAGRLGTGLAFLASQAWRFPTIVGRLPGWTLWASLFAMRPMLLRYSDRTYRLLPRVLQRLVDSWLRPAVRRVFRSADISRRSEMGEAKKSTSQ
jgi:glycosyltransferase involved in cell wall biosynthesis